MTAVEFNHFLVVRVGPLLDVDNVIILDNARTHLTAEVRVTLQQITGGNYCFSPPYSPNLKPIEKFFALVKRYIQEHEDEELRNPVDFIRHTFSLLEIDEARAGSVMGTGMGILERAKFSQMMNRLILCSFRILID